MKSDNNCKVCKQHPVYASVYCKGCLSNELSSYSEKDLKEVNTLLKVVKIQESRKR